MKAVGVKQLKARLSEYVRLVKAGETILVTDRDEVVAELRPARRQRRTGDGLEQILQGLADTGELTRASVPKLGWTWRVKGLGLPAGTAQRVLEEDPRRKVARDVAALAGRSGSIARGASAELGLLGGAPW